MDADEIQELEAYANTISAAVEEELDTLLPNVDGNEEDRLFEAMRYSVFAGGKRVRPLLIMATNEIMGGNKKRAMRVAAAMECLHTYSLIHDDLPCMDDDDLRRGKPTCHIQFDEATAVLAGDALLTMTFEILSDVDTHPDPNVRMRLVALFAEAAGARGMVGGQMMDMLAEQHGKKDFDQGALARLQRKKTGALFSASCEAALILNGGTRDEFHRFTSYAKNLGLAFQMVDDVLDEVGDEAKLGKRTKKDAGRGKATFARLLGVDGASRQAEFLVQQAVDYLRPFHNKARVLDLLARFVVCRTH
ncbi:MAG: polyprenyl synthetase family protein [Proteobacteria bacterium]|nr:polyprenyl synthetase family protein [Pseudomonadota bacterium]